MVPLFRHFGHLNYTTFLAELIATFFPFSVVCARVIATFLSAFLHLLLHLTYDVRFTS